MITFQDLPLFRAADPDTSAAGARAVRPRQGSQAMKLLAMYKDADLTDQQAWERSELWKKSGCGFWKRCSDLRRMGFITDTGDRALTTAGVKAMVCAITPAGIEALK